MSELKDKVNESVEVIKKYSKIKPDVGIILGTGLGGLAHEIKNKVEINYKDIPNFSISTLETHAGKLVLGNIGRRKVVAMQGRFHKYEGYNLKQITYPVYVMRKLGVKVLVVSNAAGGMNRTYTPGDLMVITDHISLLMGDNPLVGPNDDTLGPRYPDMYGAYDKELIKLAEKIAIEEKIKIQKGVYVMVTGPNLETPAEYRFLSLIGADAVGMSTVPEVIVARHCGLKVLGISVITDKCIADALEPANIDKIIKIAIESEPRLTKLMSLVVKKLKI
ncbi:MAG: purine-nucleoside phosphorylase [Candidatus Firestonebacteria bacterium]